MLIIECTSEERVSKEETSGEEVSQQRQETEEGLKRSKSNFFSLDPPTFTGLWNLAAPDMQEKLISVQTAKSSPVLHSLHSRAAI